MPFDAGRIFERAEPESAWKTLLNTRTSRCTLHKHQPFASSTVPRCHRLDRFAQTGALCHGNVFPLGVELLQWSLGNHREYGPISIGINRALVGSVLPSVCGFFQIILVAKKSPNHPTPAWEFFLKYLVSCRLGAWSRCCCRFVLVFLAMDGHSGERSALYLERENLHLMLADPFPMRCILSTPMLSFM